MKQREEQNSRREKRRHGRTRQQEGEGLYMTGDGRRREEKKGEKGRRGRRAEERRDGNNTYGLWERKWWTEAPQTAARDPLVANSNNDHLGSCLITHMSPTASHITSSLSICFLILYKAHRVESINSIQLIQVDRSFQVNSWVGLIPTL